MNIKLLTLITILSLLFFGFGKTSFSLNEVIQDDISELKILKYLPKDNKTIFISNTNISEIINNKSKKYEKKEQDTVVLVKDIILAYLGIDLGTKKLEDIYDNELTITSYENNERDIDDILIIFKIKETKDIDDILNLSNKIDEPNKLIKIFREHKLNYLKYIYRTNDNYIITSSNKNLILDALQSSSFSKETRKKYYPINKLLNDFKNEHNILINKNHKANYLLNSENYSLTKEDSLVTLFDLKDKKVILKSYLINNNKSLDIMSYKKIDNKSILDNTNYQISVYDNLLNINKYLNHIKIDNFEKAIFKELNEKLKQNILLLISDDNWVIVFDKNSLSFEDIKLLEDYHRDILKNNNNIYTIYSKNKLKKEDNIIKQIFYKNIFSIQSDNLTFISNSLINNSDIDLISKEFLNSKSNSNAKYFLNKKINLKSPYSIQAENIFYLENINSFFKNVINISIIEFQAKIKKSIPETTTNYFTETNLKIF